MALGHVVTRGYGNGTLAGDPNLVAVRGFEIAVAVGPWYVDSATGAGGSGSELSPFDTIADAMAVAVDDDIIYLKYGSTFNETATIGAHAITMEPYGTPGDGLPIIDGQATRADCVNVTDFDDFTLDSVRLTGSTSMGITTIRANDVTVTNCTIDDINQTGVGHAIRLHNGARATLTGNTITTTGDDAIHLTRQQSGLHTIANNNISAYGRQAGGTGDGMHKVLSSAGDYAAAPAEIYGNVIDHSNDTKAHIVWPSGGASDTTNIYSNTLTYNGTPGASGGGASLLMVDGGATNFYNNTFDGGVGIRTNLSDALEVNGILSVWGNHFLNISATVSARCLHYFLGSATGVNAANEVHFNNNTLENCDLGINTSMDCQKLRILNNIFDTVGTGKVQVTAAQTDAVINYNQYSDEASLSWNWQGTSYATLATWQAASSQDANSSITDPATAVSGTSWTNDPINGYDGLPFDSTPSIGGIQRTVAATASTGGGGYLPRKKQKPRYEKRDEERREFEQFLIRAYEEITGDKPATPEEKEITRETVKAVAQFTPGKPKRPPPVSKIDFEAMALSTEKAARLLDLLDRKRQDDEDTAITLLLM